MPATDAIVALGSNQGDRMRMLRAARDLVARLPGTLAIETSPVYETEPVGCAPEDADKPYYNTILLLGTSLEVHPLFKALQQVEAALGRKRTPGRRNEPRPIDIDLIYYDGQTIRSGGLVVPHPRWILRRFVLQPLADLRPRLVLPGHDRPVQAILAALPLSTQPVTLVMQSW